MSKAKRCFDRLQAVDGKTRFVQFMVAAADECNGKRVVRLLRRCIEGNHFDLGEVSICTAKPAGKKGPALKACQCKLKDVIKKCVHDGAKKALKRKESQGVVGHAHGRRRR